MTKNLQYATSATITKCQICDNKNLTPVMFLGYMPPVNQMHL